MIIVTLLLLVTVVMPRFEQLFADAEAVLPWATRLTLGFGRFVAQYGWLIALAFAAIGMLAMKQLAIPHVRVAVDRQVLRVPAVGTLIAQIETARFLRTLGTLLANGASAPGALRIASGVFMNRALAAATGNVLKSLKEGHSLSSLLAGAQLYPQLAVQLARVGEETGRLDAMLVEAADILDRQAQTTLERLLAILVPAVTIFMGAVVAALIGSVLMGILSVNELAA